MKKVSILFAFSMMAMACNHASTVADNGIAGQPYRAPASECKVSGNWSDCKDARRNDWADQYLLDGQGNFFAYKKNGDRDQRCQITNKVKSFKVSQHPQDAASVYFERDGDLYILLFKGDSTTANCPAQEKKVLVKDVKEYTVVSNTKSDIVNAALDTHGEFTAWTNTKQAYKEQGVVDFMMNSCYGGEKSFKSYVLFTIDRNGDVTKVKGDTEGNLAVSKATTRHYSSIQDFKETERVCQ